jgi:hypothetical protein
MKDLSDTIADGLVDRYEVFARRVRALADELSEEQFWSKPYPYGNSFGHLVLHLTGNLSYYIGARIAETGYVREREREFTESESKPKDEVLRALDEAVDVVVGALRSETERSWREAYSAEGLDGAGDRFDAYLRCATHFHLHIGQMTYLAKALTSEV